MYPKPSFSMTVFSHLDLSNEVIVFEFPCQFEFVAWEKEYVKIEMFVHLKEAVSKEQIQQLVLDGHYEISHTKKEDCICFSLPNLTNIEATNDLTIEESFLLKISLPSFKMADLSNLKISSIITNSNDIKN